MENRWPELVIIDTIGIAIGDTDKITNIINDTIKRWYHPLISGQKA